MTKSINDWFSGRQLLSNGDSLDDEVVEWQAPWDIRPAQPPVRRTTETARGKRSGKTARGTASGRTRRDGAGSGRKSTSAVPDAKPSTISETLRRQIQAAIRENPDAGSKQIAAAVRTHGVTVTKANVTEVRRQMHAARRQRAVESRRTARRRPTALPVPVAERQRVVAEMPLCNACGIRVGPTGTCRCS